MHVRNPIAGLALSLALAFGAPAQTAPGTGTTAPTTGTAEPAPKKVSKKKAAPGKSSKKKKKKKKRIDEKTRRALELMLPPTPAEETAKVLEDNEPPLLTHAPVTTAMKGKPLTITAHAFDPSGVFGPILYLRKKGLPGSEYIPMRMAASKTGAAGDYALEIPAALVNVDALEYYLEAWDNAGNGPARVGSPESPLPVKVEEEKKIIVGPPTPGAPTNMIVAQRGGAPVITHTAVAQAGRGQPIEINANLAGDTGVQGATVMFRHAGEKEYKALPMGNVGGDNYTATIPGPMANADIEYYLEAFDKYGNGPGRSGGPSTPYLVKVGSPGVAGMSQAPTERNTLIGIGIDAGAPGGGGVTRIGNHTLIMAYAHIAHDCNIGDHCYIESGVCIGDDVTIKNGNMLWEGVTIHNGVFIGPRASFSNDRYPRSPRLAEAVTRYSGREWLTRTIVQRGASIGAGAVILPGVAIGEFAMIAAGAVVAHDVPAHALVAGVPARWLKWVCRCGRPVTVTEGSGKCESCNRIVRVSNSVATCQ